MTPPPDFLPYARHSFGEEEAAAAARVVLEGRISQGPAVAEFEARAAARCGAGFAVSVSSGTAALHLAFLALELAPGDEVVVPALTFVATANAVLLAGGTPVAADIDPVDLNLSAETARARLSPRTRAICPVHFAGAPADLAALSRLASPRGIAVVEDAAQALGAEVRDADLGWYRVGRPARSRAVAFSLHPAKTISTGEGGLILTADPELDRRLRQLRHHGLVLEPRRPADH
ncbi:MAG: DegT/DnrJ/EryC1/StrS family aminotransferase, partial [Thermoanaerobaculia bacterium]